MGKFLQRYGILFFFCAMMGGIIMVDSIFAIAFTDKERGLATGFSDYTMKISILQADSQEAFRQKEFLLFLQEKAQIETINVLKANSQNGELLYSNEFESMQSNALEQAPDTYFILKDFRSYAEAHKKIDQAYRDEKWWARTAMLNTASAGKFSSDRTIEEYVRDIWHLKKIKVELK